jgi:hypothetical protein
MNDLFKLILGVLASLFRSRAKLEAEILVLRQQINVLRRRASKRAHLNNTDRFLFVWLYRWFPSTAGALAIVRPETIIRWHRVGFRAYWRWRSRNCVGRPKVPAELRSLIGEMSRENPLCVADCGQPGRVSSGAEGHIQRPNKSWPGKGSVRVLRPGHGRAGRSGFSRTVEPAWKSRKPMGRIGSSFSS